MARLALEDDSTSFVTQLNGYAFDMASAVTIPRTFPFRTVLPFVFLWFIVRLCRVVPLALLFLFGSVLETNR